jgi:peptidoglycan/LPS O-acetylase OafA/YrhL
MSHTSRHFEVLDGLRGVAALLLLVFHISEVLTYGHPEANWLPHGALTVDFFFGLSGFVIAHAYDKRMAEGMSFGGFMLRRFIRLHPMLLLSVTVGALAWVFDPFALTPHLANGAFWLAVVSALIGLPYAAVADRGDDTHSLDGPTWTLFQEYIGSIAYGLVLHRLSRKALAWLLLPTGAALLASGWIYGTLSTGWGWSNWWMAEARLAFPFLYGMLLRRSLSKLTPLRMSFVGLSVVMTVAFLAGMPGGKVGPANGLLEFAYVALLFPLIILMGAHSRMGPTTRRIAKGLGRLSYPLYIVHYPFIYWYWDISFTKGVKPEALMELAPWLFVGLTCLGVVVMRIWDEPLRSWASRRWLKTEG